MPDTQLAVKVATRHAGGQCRSCGVDITWYRLASEKLHPFNGDPAVDVQANLLGEPEPVGYISSQFSHFATCPDAATWRRAR